VKDDTGGRGAVVQDIHAPPEVVMGRITDLNNYNKMVSNCRWWWWFQEEEWANISDWKDYMKMAG